MCASVARADTGPPVEHGLVLIGSIMPKVDLLPVMDGFGTPVNFPAGRDMAEGFDAAGRVLFARRFQDDIYNYYWFVPLDGARLGRLRRLRLLVGGHVVERTASRHGAPAAYARAIGPQRVRIVWDARAFPRLSCKDESAGSPAPLMLGGTFTAIDVRGSTLRCDFSDGVKTAFAGVRIPIVRAPVPQTR